MPRILHEIKIDRIAAVDRPCQEPARAVIMKRAEGDAGGGGRRNVMRRFKIDEISAVDTPCQEHAVVALFKRGEEAPQGGTATATAPDWGKRRADALEALQRGAEGLAKSAEGLSPVAAYARFLATPEGAELYRQTL